MKSQKILTIARGLLFVLYRAVCLRRSYAKVTVGFGPPNDINSENTIRALLPKDDRTITFRRLYNVLFELRVYDRDRVKAAKRANELVLAISFKLNYEPTEKGCKPRLFKRFKIWECAEPFTPLKSDAVASPETPHSPKKKRKLSIILTREGDDYVARCPELADAVVRGTSEEDITEKIFAVIRKKHSDGSDSGSAPPPEPPPPSTPPPGPRGLS